MSPRGRWYRRDAQAFDAAVLAQAEGKTADVARRAGARRYRVYLALWRLVEAGLVYGQWMDRRTAQRPGQGGGWSWARTAEGEARVGRAA